MRWRGYQATRLPRHKWPKSWSSMEDPVVPLERNLYGHLLAGLLWERQFEKILLKHGWEKVPNWECLFVHREKGLFLSVYENEIKLAAKKQNIDPMWKVLMKVVDLGESTPFLVKVHSKRMSNEQGYCGQLQKHVRIQDFCWDYELGLWKNYQFPGNRMRTFLHGPMTWKVMQRIAWQEITMVKQNNATIFQSRDAMH